MRRLGWLSGSVSPRWPSCGRRSTASAAVAGSIRWVLGQQAAQGQWQTFVPTGPADVGRLDSTIIGALCYFHPLRLYHGAKLGADIDQAFRLTLETIWARFVTGGSGMM